jgi:hypothetical protein
MRKRDRTPAALMKGIPAAARDEVGFWWRRLPATERAALAPRREPPRIIVRFVEHEESDDAVDFYEYLVNHEVFLEDGRPFHICSAHPLARAAIARGVIPADFRCPLDRATCPMRALLAHAPGRHARLTLEGGRADG